MAGYGRRKTKAASRSYSKRTGSARRSVRRTSRASGRKSSGTVRRVAPQTIRIVFAQEPGGAALANPALPIPPSVTTTKTGKAKL